MSACANPLSIDSPLELSPPQFSTQASMQQQINENGQRDKRQRVPDEVPGPGTATPARKDPPTVTGAGAVIFLIAG